MKYYFPQDKVLTKDIIKKFIEKDRNGKVIVEGVYVRGHRQVK